MLRSTSAWSILSGIAAVLVAFIIGLAARSRDNGAPRGSWSAVGIVVALTLFTALYVNKALAETPTMVGVLSNLGVIIGVVFLALVIVRTQLFAGLPALDGTRLAVIAALVCTAYLVTGSSWARVDAWKVQDYARALLRRAPNTANSPTEIPDAQTGAVLPPETSVVILVPDALRADHCSCYGYERKTTPNLDHWAADGLLFENVIVQRPKTTPSISAFHTGLYPHTSGVWNIGDHLSRSAWTCADVLQENGFYTVTMCDNVNVGRTFGLAQGCDEVWELPREYRQRDDILMEKVADRIEELSMAGEPFYMYVHSQGPHAPYTVPDPHRDIFVGDALYRRTSGTKLPVRPRRNYHNGIASNILLEDVDEQRQRDPAFYTAAYDSRVHFADAALARVFDRIRKLALQDELLVVVTSDHGESHGEHGYYFQHGATPYDEELRVPLIVKHPLIRCGREKQQFPHFATAPAILDLLGLEYPQPVDAPVLSQWFVKDGPTTQAPIFSIAGYRGRAYAVRTNRHKLIWRPPRAIPNPSALWSISSIAAGRAIGQLRTNSEWEFYDLQADPGEQDNLWPESSEQALALQSSLLQWICSLPRQPRFERLEKEMKEDTRQDLRDMGYID